VQVSRQRQEGYRLACLREPSSGTVVAVAGYRVFETFFDGKVASSPRIPMMIPLMHAVPLVRQGSHGSLDLVTCKTLPLQALAHIFTCPTDACLVRQVMSAAACQ
jgi:hypothetical protein